MSWRELVVVVGVLVLAWLAIGAGLMAWYWWLARRRHRWYYDTPLTSRWLKEHVYNKEGDRRWK